MNAQTKNACPKLEFVILALAIFGASFVFVHGLTNFRSGDRFVTVKGLAVQNVEADLALWPIKHVATGVSLADVQSTIEANEGKIMAFLRAQGFESSDIVGRKIEVTDLLAQAYRQQNVGNERFIISQTLTVRTNKIEEVEKAFQNVGELLSQNVSLDNQNNASAPSYLYTKLNDIKPGMIAEATRNARESAEQFANDSGASVGDIREAWQGVFEILPRDSDMAYTERQERYKTVRVVSTLKYRLD